MAVILRYFSEFAYLPGGMLKVTFAISSPDEFLYMVLLFRSSKTRTEMLQVQQSATFLAQIANEMRQLYQNGVDESGQTKVKLFIGTFSLKLLMLFNFQQCLCEQNTGLFVANTFIESNDLHTPLGLL